MNAERPDVLTPVKPELGLRARFELWRIVHGLGEKNIQPIGRRLAIAAGLTPAAFGLLATACADDNVTPTTIEKPTTTVPPTTLPPTTTTTEAPTTTTSTTEAETTTTLPENICYPPDVTPPPIDLTKLPEDITQPRGNILTDGKEVELGVFTNELYISNPGEEILNGRVVRCYLEKWENFLNTGQTEVLIADLIMGQYDDGTPIIVKVAFGRPDVDVHETVMFFTEREYQTGRPTIYNYYPVSEFANLLIKRLAHNDQIGIVVNTLFAPEEPSIEEYQEYLKRCTDGFESSNINIDPASYCEFFFESGKYGSNNNDLVTLLDQPNPSASNKFPEDKLVFVRGIFFFAP